MSQIDSPVRTPARFEIVREAGTFVCEGDFVGGHGTGTYLFRANPEFREQMLALGVGAIEDDQFLSMALYELGPRFVRELRAAGATVSTGSQLLRMRDQGVTSDSIPEIRRLSFAPNVDPRRFGITRAPLDRNLSQPSFNYSSSKAIPSVDNPRTWAIEWPALTGPNMSPAPDRIQLVFFKAGGITSNAFEFDASVFRGLNPSEMRASVRTAVRFDIVREAGTFACEGSFQTGRGTGTFVFQPNPEFRGQMLALGLLDLDDRRLQEMAMLDVGPRYVAELREAGLTVPTVSQLLEMRMQGLTAEYVREIHALGFNPRGSEWMSLRVQGVRADFAREVLKTHPSATVGDLVNLKIQGFGKK